MPIFEILNSLKLISRKKLQENFINFHTVLQGLHSDNKSEANDAAISIILRLESCHTGNLDLLGLPFTLRGLHFDSDEDHVPTKGSYYFTDTHTNTCYIHPSQ